MNTAPTSRHGKVRGATLEGIRRAQADTGLRSAMRRIVPTDPARDPRSAEVVYAVIDESSDSGYFPSELAVSAAMYLWAVSSDPSYPSTRLTLSGGNSGNDTFGGKPVTASLRELALKAGKGGTELSPGITRRVTSALSARSFEDLVARLRPLCVHAENEGIAIDYGKLATDLYSIIKNGVDNPDISALTRWNKSFWKKSAAERAVSSTNDTTQREQ